MARVADDFEVAGVLDSLNREDQGTWHLVCRLGGGRKTGAWVAEDRDGVRAVLKWHSSASTRRDLDGTAALVARARGWPTPAWLAWGLDRRRRPYVLAEGGSVTDPASGRVLLRSGSLRAIAGHLALTVGEPLHPLTLTDLRTGTRRALRWPSQIGGPDQAAVDPGAKLIALSFSDPAYQGTGVQVTDVWLLDPGAGRWQHLPGMPADVALKFTSMSWTSDGRLVMLAQTPTSGPASHVVIAVWRPGQKSLAVRSVHIPARDSGSDSFLAWVRPST